MTKTKLLLYYIALFVVWSVFELLFRPMIGEGIPSAWLFGLIKTVVWILPCALILWRVPQEMSIWPICNGKNLLQVLPVLGVFVLCFGMTYYTRGVQLQFDWSQFIGGVLFAGITEEIVFRGFLLNRMLKLMRPWVAIVLNAVAFLVIHFPIWIRTGMFVSAFAGFGFLTVTAIGVLFGIMFIKSKNLWVPIILHASWNLLAMMMA